MAWRFRRFIGIDPACGYSLAAGEGPTFRFVSALLSHIRYHPGYRARKDASVKDSVLQRDRQVTLGTRKSADSAAKRPILETILPESTDLR
jgi:hypothetical protein